MSEYELAICKSGNMWEIFWKKSDNYNQIVSTREASMVILTFN